MQSSLDDKTKSEEAIPEGSEEATECTDSGRSALSVEICVHKSPIPEGGIIEAIPERGSTKADILDSDEQHCVDLTIQSMIYTGHKRKRRHLSMEDAPDEVLGSPIKKAKI